MATASPVLQLGLLRMRPLQRWLKPRVPHNAWRHGRLHIRVNQACVTALTPWKNPRWMEKGVATGLVHTRKVVTTDRLGGAVQRQTDLRPLVEDGERLPHQLLGNASRLSSLPVFPAGPNRTPCADSLRCNGCMPVRAVCKPHPGSRPARWVGADPCRGGYIGAVTRTGVRFRGVSVTDVCQ